MPAPRRNAEAGTVDEQSPAALGNVDAEALIQDLGATQELMLKQEQMIQQLAAQVEELRQAKAKADRPAHVPKPYSPPVLREGFKRYTSRYTELTLMRVGTGYEMMAGQKVPVPIQTGKPIEFNGGVYETDDSDEIEFIESHVDFGTVIWEDPTAVRRHSQVEVVDGMKSVASTPKVPLSAPMAP